MDFKRLLHSLLSSHPTLFISSGPPDSSSSIYGNGLQSIVFYGQAEMLPDAIKAFEEMIELGVGRNTKTLNALLRASFLAKNYKEMNRIFVEFPKIYEILPNIDIYNTVIKELCESGESSSAYSILADMEIKGINPNTTTFKPMIAGFYLEHEFGDVGKVLKTMKELGIHQTVHTYIIRIKSLCKMGRSNEAKALFLGFMSSIIKPNTVTYIAT